MTNSHLIVSHFNLTPLSINTAFDPNVIEIQKEDTQDFLGALDNALKKATPDYFTSSAVAAGKAI